VLEVLISGGSGFIGRHLARALVERGDKVTVLTRDPERARARFPSGVRCVAWTPDEDGPWASEIEAASAVVHLAGEPVAQRWSPAVKLRIRASRVGSTRLIVDAIGKAKHKPGVLVCASATGYYGPRRPDEQLDEDSAPGQGFLADVVRDWEAAARAVEAHGVRSVQLRIGVVLGEGGGALDKMILPFKLFAGGPIGDGAQVISWIHRDDVVGLILLALDDPRVTGAINAVAPAPVTGTELARALGAALHRPSFLRTPAFAIKLAMGEAAEIVTTGQRVLPKKALELGYAFHHPTVLPALESVVGAR
jgi:uncharacterized protein (TIGR01777 family)